MRVSDDELADIKARNPVADVAGGYVKLRRAGSRLVGPCPICGGRVTSQRFEVTDDGWVCAVCPDGGDVIRLVEKVEGCDFLAAIERLGGRQAIDNDRARQLLEEREKKRLAREKQSDKYREAERKRLFRTWRARAAIAGTAAADYLAQRSLVLPEACPGLGFLAAAPYWHGEEVDERGKTSARKIHEGPAMLAAFIRPDGFFGGLHMTYLDAGGGGVTKLDLPDPDTGELLNAKKMRGSKTGAHIAVSAIVEQPRRLIIGEGIETVLSVWTALAAGGRALDAYAFWAAGDLGNLAGRATETLAHPTLRRPDGKAQRVPGPFPDPDDAGLGIPDSVEELVLLGDGDSDAVLTEYAMTRAARRYARPGRAIRIAFAPAGKDFNDVLREAA
jgi:hypothetical protein